MKQKNQTITVTHELDNGDIQVIEVEYSINPYYPATREEPEEGGDIDFHSISENDIELEDVSEELYKIIEEKIYDSLADGD